MADDKPETQPAESPEPTPTTAHVELSADGALCIAARLLFNAESITDIALMERYIEMANSWILISRSITEQCPHTEA